MRQLIYRREQREPALEVQEGRLWFPVYTQPLREGSLCRYLEARDIPSYLPRLRKVSYKNVRRPSKVDTYEVVRYSPMFPGYVFAQLSEDELAGIWRSGSVVRILRDAENLQAQLLRELRTIRLFEVSQDTHPVEVFPELVEGARFVIEDGIWRGVYGVVTRRKSRTVFAVKLEFLRQTIVAEIDLTQHKLIPV